MKSSTSSLPPVLTGRARYEWPADLPLERASISRVKAFGRNETLPRIHQAKAAMAVVGLCGMLGLAVPAMAQNRAAGDAGKSDPSQTGIGERGTKVAPSTQPGQANEGTASAGMESRGSRTAPSSNEKGKPTTGH